VDPNAWTGTTEQKVFGLMTVWSEAKYAFPWFDKLPELNWDRKVQEYLPRVIAARDIDEYYKVLGEFTALLKDGHTSTRPPWEVLKPSDDYAAVEIQVVDGRFYLARLGNSEEINSQNLRPGMEILEVEMGIPVTTSFEENVQRYYRDGNPRASETWAILLAVGPRGSKAELMVKDPGGATRRVSLTRDGMSQRFFPRLMQWAIIEKRLDIQRRPDGVVIVRIPNFGNPQMALDFANLVDSLDPATTKGLIMDLRYNTGGSSLVANDMVACLIEGAVSSPLRRFPQYIAAYRAWGRKAPMLENMSEIKPRNGKRYLGPLVILTGLATGSSGEDVAIELSQKGRALRVGERTMGSAGNPISITLPGGGKLKVATFQAYLPDGQEYVHIGLRPDVEVAISPSDLLQSLDPILTKGLEVISQWETFRKACSVPVKNN
jgi:C-terminal processing protease CtpA/Prc